MIALQIKISSPFFFFSIYYVPFMEMPHMLNTKTVLWIELLYQEGYPKQFWGKLQLNKLEEKNYSQILSYSPIEVHAFGLF